MKKAIVSILVLVLVLSSFGTVVYARQPDKAFTYDHTGVEAVPSTNIYQVKVIVDEYVMGTTKMENPTDIFVDKQDRIFILDSGNCRVLVLDKEYKCIKVLEEFTYKVNVDGEVKEEILTLAKDAQGLFFRDATQMLYIADTENNRILVTDLDGNVLRVHEKPKDENKLLKEEDAYKPKKVIVDNMGIMYVTSGLVNTGALLVDSENNFLGFYGINKIKASSEVLTEYFWRSIMTDAMNAQSEMSFQPVEFYNMFWSEDRFVYAVSPINDKVASSVVKLNALGNDVSPQPIEFSEDYLKSFSYGSSLLLADITVDNDGAITLLEQETGRIFQYDGECNLLAAFGGKGYQKGSFQKPVSIESDSKNNILILDKEKKTVTVMEQTFYGQMIRTANRLYNEGLYMESIEPWQEVLRMNANYTQAYVGMGKAFMSMGDYKKAMEYFELGQSKEDYADAKAALREEIIRDNFAVVAIVVVVILLGILFFEQIRDLIDRIYWRLTRKRG